MLRAIPEEELEEIRDALQQANELLASYAMTGELLENGFYSTQQKLSKARLKLKETKELIEDENITNITIKSTDKKFYENLIDWLCSTKVKHNSTVIRVEENEKKMPKV